MLNLYLIKNNFLSFMIEFLKKKIVIIFPFDNYTLEYFIEDNIYRLSISGNHYYFFMNDFDRIQFMNNIRNDIFKFRKQDCMKNIEIVNDKFINDESYDIRMNSIQNTLQLIEYYEINEPFIHTTNYYEDIQNALIYYDKIIYKCHSLLI
jgi:hypothetical protein